MKMRRLVYVFGLVAALVLVGVMTFQPEDTANACLPCDCPENTTINCYGSFGIFVIENEVEDEESGQSQTQCDIQILGVSDAGAEYEAMYLSADDLAELPESPEENILVEEYYEYAFYKLTSGEYQVNVGPDAENKVYVVNFAGCPVEDVRESTFIPGEDS